MDAVDRDVLVTELADVREVGIYRVHDPRLRVKRRNFDNLEHLLPPVDGMAFSIRLERTIRESVKALPDETLRVVAEMVFGLDQPTLFEPDPVIWRKEALKHYNMRRNAVLHIEEFRKGPEREILGFVAEQIAAQAEAREYRANSGSRVRAPEDLLVERSLLHVVRTLEARLSHTAPGSYAATRITKALDAYARWHIDGVGDAARVLDGFNGLSKDYFGKPIYELLGRISMSGAGPDEPPHTLLSWCRYPNGVSMQPIPGGVDFYTGEEVAPFYLATYPVTMLEWHNFVTRFEWPTSGTWKDIVSRIPAWQQRPEIYGLPAVGMTFHDCVVYCHWLWSKTPYRFRLPTESEWNFAATGGQPFRFPWGNEDRADLANFSTHAPRPGPVRVDQLPPSGPHDVVGLSGNVWEYTSTLWRDEQPVPDSGVAFPDILFSLARQAWWEADSRIKNLSLGWREELRFVMKGGSWGLGPKYGEVSSRIYSSFHNYGEYGGLRLAVSAVQDEHEWRPEMSPFMNMNLQEARLVKNVDFAGELEVQASEYGACGNRISFRPSLPDPSAPSASSTWDQLLRMRYSAEG